MLYRSLLRRIGKVSTMARMERLEDLKDAFGSDLLALITGHDVDADKRQRNRQIVSSGNYKPTREEMQTLLECIPGRMKPGDGIRPPAPRLSLVLP
jgi:hypothetical protein